MANRTEYVGTDTPDDEFMLTDETFDGTSATVPDFTGCTLTAEYIGKDFEFGDAGTCYPISPATVDPKNSKVFYNVGYTFDADDMSDADVYATFIKVIDADGKQRTWDTGSTLTVKALPTVAA